MTNENSITIKNLESAFAGESMAHIKYMYFARVCRAQGDEETAKVFEKTASQEVQHAFGHLDLLMPASELNAAKCLELAIEGETHEYTKMYPEFRHMAMQEGNHEAVKEMSGQIEESREHAQMFQKTLELAEKRFEVLTRVEQKHANHYREVLKAISI